MQNAKRKHMTATCTTFDKGLSSTRYDRGSRLRRRRASASSLFAQKRSQCYAFLALWRTACTRMMPKQASEFANARTLQCSGTARARAQPGRVCAQRSTSAPKPQHHRHVNLHAKAQHTCSNFVTWPMADHVLVVWAWTSRCAATQPALRDTLRCDYSASVNRI